MSQCFGNFDIHLNVMCHPNLHSCPFLLQIQHSPRFGRYTRSRCYQHKLQLIFPQDSVMIVSLMKRQVSAAMKDVPATSVDNCVLAEVEGRAEQDPEETRAVIFPPSS